MKYRKIYLKDDEEKNENVPADIPPDDGHQMSQSEIDNLIAQLLNQ